MPGVARERLDQPLVVRAERRAALLVGQVQVADRAALDRTGTPRNCASAGGRAGSRSARGSAIRSGTRRLVAPG